MPSVGIAVDRRTIKHVSLGVKTNPPTSLVCACCKCQYTCIDGLHTEMGRIEAAPYFSSISATSFRYNWDYTAYQKQYGNTNAMEHHSDLEDSSWTFRRILKTDFFYDQQILCCPQDVSCSEAHPVREIHGCCRLPLCRQCYTRSICQNKEECKIPRALCNDNFYGFMDKEILRCGVRWIELAAASPILNCIVTYYVEGDRGHLMDKNLPA